MTMCPLLHIKTISCRYRFDVSKLGQYHELNQKRGRYSLLKLFQFDFLYCIAKDAMRHGVTPVIIDNTNTRCHEMRPYVAAVSTS